MAASFISKPFAGVRFIVTEFHRQLRWLANWRIVLIELGFEIVPIRTQFHRGNHRAKMFTKLRIWAIGDLIDAALATQSITPVPTAPDRRKGFRVIQGGRT